MAVCTDIVTTHMPTVVPYNWLLTLAHTYDYNSVIMVITMTCWHLESTVQDSSQYSTFNAMTQRVACYISAIYCTLAVHTEYRDIVVLWRIVAINMQ